MKHLLILLAFILHLTLSWGQTISKKIPDKKWTAGIILFNESNPYFLVYDDRNGRFLNPNFFTGMIIKRNLKKYSLRGGIEYLTIIDKKEERISRAVDKYGYVKEGIIRLGIEKGFVFKKHYKPYAALDLFAMKGYSDITHIGGHWGWTNERRQTNYLGFGAMPTLGFEFLISKQISIALETRLRINHIKSRDEIEDYETNSIRIVNYKQNFVTSNRISAITLNLRF